MSYHCHIKYSLEARTLLSYQHGFHAGNFADLHKHLVLSMLLEALNRKAKPWSYFETHSGRGYYDLSSEQAQKTGEYLDGVAKLWGKDQSALVNGYLDRVKELSLGEQLTAYPGSPMLAAMAARADDRLHLMELHPQEIVELKRAMRRFSQVGVHHRDGYEGVLGLLPPKPNRGLILIDPAYEVKDEYLQVADFVAKSLQRWPNAQLAVWYPLLSADRHEAMLTKIAATTELVGLYDSRFIVAAPQERGMYGSGMLLINPPWQIDQQIENELPKVLEQLDAQAPEMVTNWIRQSA
jgi:23S rRNA (adenine2030-N6)-methyltransferase